jgi:hypothetical protein
MEFQHLDIPKTLHVLRVNLHAGLPVRRFPECKEGQGLQRVVGDDLFSTFRKLPQERHHQAKVIIPVTIRDGEAFPEEAKNIQAANFADFVIIGQGFKETKRYSEFQEALKAFSERVAQLVSEAPAFQPWPIFEKHPPDEEPEITQETL